ncbi:hypothetical protein LG634_28200 [Streptomyces bambusae]|uniref:hypothetical protein n=1 Tax=Streptomyces bambusae TaxID=1550616 RepID=UPI001CFDB0AC|nr:hypothetical protein [Streptomyces bambusae]MCB5168691.1 hypothetical protein [Streptomyces bambusae]
MPGEQIGEEQGRITGMRVLAADGGHAVVGASFQGAGALRGKPVKDMGTYESVVRADGTLFGDGQGVVTTGSGEVLTWHGSGVGRFTEPGGVNWRGAIFYEAAAGGFEGLTGISVLFEFDTEESGEVTARLFEWT